ncbi:unnamed protein product [Lactuca virosa]|uniref:Uncharacterized protein n=1 Tax=Lactuca virosa TaxID=75947 RepID=A0AAU9N2X4_9ASTR|nr:unnamed protein product [Lactuca virosa]
MLYFRQLCDYDQILPARKSQGVGINAGPLPLVNLLFQGAVLIKFEEKDLGFFCLIRLQVGSEEHSTKSCSDSLNWVFSWYSFFSICI